MVELNRYCEKLIRRLGNDGRLLQLLLEAFSGRDGVLNEEGTTLRGIFQDNEGEQIGRVEAALAEGGYKTDLAPDEEHGLWEIDTDRPRRFKS